VPTSTPHASGLGRDTTKGTASTTAHAIAPSASTTLGPETRAAAPAASAGSATASLAIDFERSTRDPTDEAAVVSAESESFRSGFNAKASKTMFSGRPRSR